MRNTHEEGGSVSTLTTNEESILSPAHLEQLGEFIYHIVTADSIGVSLASIPGDEQAWVCDESTTPLTSALQRVATGGEFEFIDLETLGNAIKELPRDVFSPELPRSKALSDELLAIAGRQDSAALAALNATAAEARERAEQDKAPAPGVATSRLAAEEGNGHSGPRM